MKHSKFFLGLIVLLSAMVVLAGCGGNKSGTKTVNGKVIHPMRYVVPQTEPSDYETGIKAVNAKLLADGYDIEVQVIRIPWDSYEQKLNIMLSTGEPFEMVHVMGDIKNLTFFATRNAVVPITKYVDKYPTIKNLFTKDEWLAGTYNGEIYAVPVMWRSEDNALGYLYARTDFMAETGYPNYIPGILPAATPDDVLTLMKRQQDYIQKEVGRKAYHYPHNLAVAPYWLHRYYDTYPFFVERSLGVILSRQDGTIDSYFESDEFKNDAQFYRKMYQQGFIHPDLLSQDVQVIGNSEWQNGAVLPSESFGFSANTLAGTDDEPGTMPYVTGDYMWAERQKPDLVYTISQNTNAISSTAEDPESGIKFLNWLYTSQENYNLWHNGVEGVHYNLDDAGDMQVVNDPMDAPLYSFEAWMTGNKKFWVWPSTIDPAFVEFFNYASQNKVTSPIAAFLFDASSVASELANIQTEIIASFYPIKWGMVDYNTGYAAALSRLKTAGLDKYMAEYRRQFAEYLKANPNVLEYAK
jgi:putative aldouronate transport system substrate-binding protein